MSQRYNDKRKGPKQQDTPLGILKIYKFCLKNQQRALDPGESAAGVRYLSLTIHLKSCGIFPQNVIAILLNGSRKGAVEA